MCVGDLRERRDKARQVLSWLHGPEREQVGRGAVPPIGLPWRRGRDVLGRGVEAGRHDMNPVGVDPQQLGQLVADKAREHVHQRPVSDRPCHKARVGQRGRGTELRIPHGGQVEDRHDPPGVACRWDDVVRPVHHVHRPDQPFDRWHFNARP